VNLRCQPGRRGYRSIGRRGGERGAALVEFVLILPLLLMVIFGGVTTATAYHFKSGIVQAVRDGARYGATVPVEQCDTVTNCGNRNWAQLVQYVTSKQSEGALTTGDICVALVAGSTGAVYTRTGGVYSAGPGSSTGCFNDGNADTGMRAHVSGTRNGEKIILIIANIPVSLSSKAAARYEQ